MSEINQLKDKIEARAKLAEANTKTMAQAFTHKQISWVVSNWLALAIGFACGIALGLLL